MTASGVLRASASCEGKQGRETRRVPGAQSKKNVEKEGQKAASLTLVTQDHPLSSPRSAQVTLSPCPSVTWSPCDDLLEPPCDSHNLPFSALPQSKYGLTPYPVRTFQLLVAFPKPKEAYARGLWLSKAPSQGPKCYS